MRRRNRFRRYKAIIYKVRKRGAFGPPFLLAGMVSCPARSTVYADIIHRHTHRHWEACGNTKFTNW